jgi:hypothetical protein
LGRCGKIRRREKRPPLEDSERHDGIHHYDARLETQRFKHRLVNENELKDMGSLLEMSFAKMHKHSETKRRREL